MVRDESCMFSYCPKYSVSLVRLKYRSVTHTIQFEASKSTYNSVLEYSSIHFFGSGVLHNLSYSIITVLLIFAVRVLSTIYNQSCLLRL